MSVRVTGGAQVKRKLSEAEIRYREALGAAEYAEAAEMLERAKPNVPVDKGNLWASRYIRLRHMRKEPRVEVGFGARYALIQHERTDYSHPGGGKAKFLETAMHAARPGFVQRMAARTRANFASGVTTAGIAKVAPSSPRRSRK